MKVWLIDFKITSEFKLDKSAGELPFPYSTSMSNKTMEAYHPDLKPSKAPSP